MRTLFLAISLCFLSVPLMPLGRISSASATRKVLSDTAQYQIYSEVIANFLGRSPGAKASDPILVSDHTLVPAGSAKSAAQQSIIDRFLIGRFSEALEEATVADYDKNRAEVVFFDARFSPELRVVLLSDAERVQLFKKLYNEHPASQGVVTLSRIGFNARRTQALVALEYFCGVFCTNNQIFLVARSGSAWKVQSRIAEP